MSLPSRQVDAEVGMCVASAETIVPHHDSPARRPNMCFWHRHCVIYARARWRPNFSMILFGYVGKYPDILYLATRRQWRRALRVAVIPSMVMIIVCCSITLWLATWSPGSILWNWSMQKMTLLMRTGLQGNEGTMDDGGNSVDCD